MLAESARKVLRNVTVKNAEDNITEDAITDLAEIGIGNLETGDKRKKREYVESDSEKTRIPFYTPFVEQKKDIDRSSTLYSINAPIQFVHADVAGDFSQILQWIRNMLYSASICFHPKSTFIP